MSSFKLALMGDVMLGRLVNQHLKTATPEYPWGNTLPILRQADLRICNLECVISDKGRPWSATPKVFHFRSDAKNLNVLRSARIDTVSLANNHVLDFEYEAMDEMLQLLDNTKIAHAGAGRDRYLASMPATVQKGKVRIGLIAFTDNEPGWEAGKNRPGVFYVPIDVDDHRSQVLLSLVEKIKRQVNCLVVSAHWGGNWGYQPPPEHPPFARALIDAGADIIFGHSTHVFRGIEIYKGRPILYSTGDFIDDYAVDEIERNDESFIFMIETQPTHTTGYDPIAGRSEIKRLTLYPTVIDNFQARLAGVRAQAIAAKMTQLCQNLGTKTIWRPERQYLQIPLA